MGEEGTCRRRGGQGKAWGECELSTVLGLYEMSFVHSLKSWTEKKIKSGSWPFSLKSFESLHVRSSRKKLCGSNKTHCGQQACEFSNKVWRPQASFWSNSSVGLVMVAHSHLHSSTRKAEIGGAPIGFEDSLGSRVNSRLAWATEWISGQLDYIKWIPGLQIKTLSQKQRNKNKTHINQMNPNQTKMVKCWEVLGIKSMEHGGL